MIWFFIWAALYGVSYSLTNLLYPSAIPYAVVVYAVLLLVWLGYRRCLKEFHICKPVFQICRLGSNGKTILPASLQIIGIFLLLLILPAANLLSGSSFADGKTMVLMFGAVIVEEVFFRGVLLADPGVHTSDERIVADNPLLTWVATKPEIVRAGISSGLFALFHAANALGGGTWSQVIPQMFCAFCAGMLFAAVTLRTNSLLPAAVSHFFINITAAEENPLSFPIAAGSIICLVSGSLLLFPALRLRFLQFFLRDSR